jgi:dolichol-phosphate mannosyltransferase
MRRRIGLVGQPDISVVVPLLDEAPGLAELHARLVETLGAMGCAFEIVFVDDGSTDGTVQALEQITEGDERVRVVELRRTFGKAAALAAGFREARGDTLVTLDGDLQDRPEEIPRLLEALERGADLVVGRKRDRSDPWTRRAASWVFNRALSLATGMRTRDVNSGLKVLRRDVVREVPLHGRLHRFLLPLAAARGFRVAEVDVAHDPRRYGRSRYGMSRYGEAALDTVTVLLLTRFGKRPLHFFGIFGGLLSLLGGGILAYLAVGWLFGVWIGGRPLLTFGVLFTILGIQCLFFGLLAEMIVLLGAREDRGYSVRRVVGGGAAPVEAS